MHRSTAAPGVTLVGADKSHRRYGPRLRTMRKRAEFQRLRGGVRWSGSAFLLEGKPRSETTSAIAPSEIASSITAGSAARASTTAPQTSGVRYGFTITKKVGKAHERNRMRRRLSHALRLVDVPANLATWDCVVIARPASLDIPFDQLVADFNTAISKLARANAVTAARPKRQS